MSDQAATPAPRRFMPLAMGAILLAVFALVAYFALFDQQKAPDVVFTNIQGKKISSQDLRGKVVMVNFWATSCTTCVKEMPRLVDTYNKHKDRGLEFVAVAMSYDPPNYVLNYAETRKLPFHVALDVKGDLAKAFGDVQMTPTTFVIDKNGRILKRYLGEPDWNSLNKLLGKALS